MLGSKQAQTLGRQAIYRAAVHVTIAGVLAWRVATDVQRRVEREGTFSRLNLDQLCPARPWSVAGLEHVWCAANILLETGQFRGSLRAGRDKLYDS